MQLNNSKFNIVLIQAVDPEQADKVGEFIKKLKTFRNGDVSFTFVLDDISGNSFVENPHAPNKDEAMTITKYDRTAEQNRALGFEVTDGNCLKCLCNEILFNVWLTALQRLPKMTT